MPCTAKITFELVGARGNKSLIHRCEAGVTAANKGFGMPAFVLTSELLEEQSAYTSEGVLTIIADVLIK